MRRYLLCIVLFMSIFVHGANAQEMDFGGMLGVEVSKDLSRRFAISLEEEVRFRDNFSTYDRWTSALGVDYSIISKKLKVGAIYTYMNDNNSSHIIADNHRFAAQVQYRQDVGLFKFTLRGRFQSTLREEVEKEYKVNPKNYIRARLQASYCGFGSRWETSLSGEVFYLFDPYGNTVDKIRCELSTEYRLDKRSSLGWSLRVDNPVITDEPVTKVMIGMYYKFGM